HRPVVDGEQMLVRDTSQRMEAAARAAGEDDPLQGAHMIPTGPAGASPSPQERRVGADRSAPPEGEARLALHLTTAMPGSGRPLVSAIVVSHNVRDLLMDTLRTVLNEARPPLEVIVVDNASADGSADAVEFQFPQVQLIRLQRN